MSTKKDIIIEQEPEANMTFGIGDRELTGPELRKRIEDLEHALFNVPEYHIEIEPKHYHANGLYAREILIPKGTVLTGKIHKCEHINVISKGDISVLTDHGIERIKAPFTIISQPGTKRVGYAHEDTIWTTFHATTETDQIKLEEELIAPSHAAFEEYKNSLLLLEKK